MAAALFGPHSRRNIARNAGALSWTASSRQCVRQPTHPRSGVSDRGINALEVPCRKSVDRCPAPSVLRVRSELLVTEAARGAFEEVHAVTAVRRLDAAEHYPSVAIHVTRHRSDRSEGGDASLTA